MQKLGLKSVAGISRVVVKNSKNIMFVIQNPEVYKSPSTDTYVVFGEASVEDPTQMAQARAAEQFRASADNAPKATAAAPSSSASAASSEPEEAVDETGLEANDIELVVSQANCSRAKAVKALRNNGGDIVNAIMELTM